RNHRSVKIPYYFQNFKCSSSKLSAENYDRSLLFGLTRMMTNEQGGHPFMACCRISYIHISNTPKMYLSHVAYYECKTLSNPPLRFPGNLNRNNLRRIEARKSSCRWCIERYIQGLDVLY